MLRRTRFRPDLTKAAGGVNKSWKGVVDLAGAVDYSNLPVKDYFILVPACGLFARLEVSAIF